MNKSQRILIYLLLIHVFHAPASAQSGPTMTFSPGSGSTRAHADAGNPRYVYVYGQPFTMNIENISGSNFSRLSTQLNRQISDVRRFACARGAELIIESIQLQAGMTHGVQFPGGTSAGSGLGSNNGVIAVNNATGRNTNSTNTSILSGNAVVDVVCRSRTRVQTIPSSNRSS